ncbi:MAG: HemK family protein methyltransferase [Bacteriovoracales bacterium]|nr:HemK family protein methyltransferase [Bacteriovoracales bacterium]
MREGEFDEFFSANRKQLTHWHPGLSPRILKENTVGLSEEEIRALKNQLLQGVPLAYAVEARFFYEALFFVDDRVLIPRMESELIIELLEKKWKGDYRTLLDVGTGCGCLGLSAAIKFQDLSCVVLMDSSPKALRVAAINREKLSYRFPPSCSIETRQASCVENLPRADVIVANPPYIKRSRAFAIHPQVYRYEPHEALFVEDEHYEHWYRRFFDLVAHSICGGGLFVMEGEPDLLPGLLSMIAEYDRVEKCDLEKDLTGKLRFLWGIFEDREVHG